MKNTTLQRLSRWSLGNLGAFGMTAAIGVLGLGAVAQQCAPAPAPSPPPIVQVAGVQDGAVSSVNRHRTAVGLTPLVVDSRLTSAAQSHANDMASRRVMSHTGSNGSNAGQRIAVYGYGAAMWAENVAAGYATAADAVNAWMNSSGHRANIVNNQLVNIGVAAATGSNGIVYWSMVFAA